MIEPEPDGGELYGWLPERAEVARKLALETEATARGWQRAADPSSGAWSVHTPDKTKCAGYAPPGPVCAGVVSAHDADRTLTLTGVVSLGEAVDRIREFLGWPEPAPDQPEIDVLTPIALGDSA